MATPEPPKPEDFKITTVDVSRFEERERRFDAAQGKLSLYGAFAASAAVLALETNWKWTLSAGFLSASTYWAFAGLCLEWLFGSLFALTIVGPVVLLTGKLYVRLSPNFEAVRRYKKAVSEFNEWLRRSRESWWTRLDGRGFELELARLFRAIGWAAAATKASGDGGVDIVGARDGVEFIAQCKKHRKEVGPAVVRELYGTLLASNAEFAILASVSGFTKGAREFAKGKKIEFIDLRWILAKHMSLDGGWHRLANTASPKSKIRIRLKRSL